MNTTKYIVLLIFLIMMVGCAEQVEPEMVDTETPMVTEAVENVENTQAVEQETEIIELQLSKDEDGNDTHRVYPNLWTQISPEKFTVYPSNILWEYTFDHYGNLWMAGEFGIIYRGMDGTVTHYTMNNGLPINAFRVIAVAPDGQVWAGGEDNMLVRFDGEVWHDEGMYLPIPYDTRKQYAHDRDYIVDIDFDDEGNIWVLNVKFELFTVVYGQWINFVFPKQITPPINAGMFADGLRVYSVNNMFVGHPGCCCASSSTYHYDGVSWEASGDYRMIEEKNELRHAQYAQMSLLEWTGIDPDVWPRKATNITYPPEKIIPLVTEIPQNWHDYTFQFNNPPTEMFMSGWSNSEENIIHESGNDKDIYQVENIPQPVHFIKSDMMENTAIASDTMVAFITEDSFCIYEFLQQDAKPVVMIGEYYMPSFRDEYHPRYKASGFNFGDFHHDVHHTAKLLHYMEDDTLLFATDHLLAQRKDGGWRSFYFDTVTFDSVTVDDEGFIWVYAGVNGFLRFSPDIFEDYVNYWGEEES